MSPVLLAALPFVREFPATSLFGALYAAEVWAASLGYTVGRRDYGDPIPLILGADSVGTWGQLDYSTVLALDGVILPGSDSFRANVTVRLRVAPPDTLPSADEVIAAGMEQR